MPLGWTRNSALVHPVLPQGSAPPPSRQFRTERQAREGSYVNRIQACFSPLPPCWNRHSPVDRRSDAKVTSLREWAKAWRNGNGRNRKWRNRKGRGRSGGWIFLKNGKSLSKIGRPSAIIRRGNHICATPTP